VKTWEYNGSGNIPVAGPNTRAASSVSAAVSSFAADSPIVAVDGTRDFDGFFRVEYPRLLRVLSAADVSADDALQDAFTKAALAWRRISKYEDPAGWVRRVAVHRMLDERRSVRRKHAAIERMHALAPTDVDDGDATLDLARAIDLLPTRQRVALSLFYLGGLTSAETGAAMGITAGTVRFHLHEARARLRELLEVRDD
jgi:RNA polymerase sigma-70 factor (ECF subfamily)